MDQHIRIAFGQEKSVLDEAFSRTISGLESDLDLEQERLKALLAELAKIFQNPLYARERFI
jgi:hypothetical protein